MTKSECINLGTARAYGAGILPKKRKEAIDKHAQTCVPCASLLLVSTVEEKMPEELDQDTNPGVPRDDD